MNLRHASALALVGWYLMLPPANESYFKLVLEHRFQNGQLIKASIPRQTASLCSVFLIENGT